MALILLRHAEPEIGAGICYGRSDIGARPFGDSEWQDIRRALPGNIVRLDTSPLQRCRALADRLGDELDLPARPDPRLAEIDFGRWELQAWDDIPRGEIDLWANDVEGARPHGGESVAQMIERVASYLRHIAGTEGHVLAVTHQGVARCAAAVLGWESPFELKLGFGRFLIIEAREAL